MANIFLEEPYSRAMQGMRLLARHNLPVVVDTLVQWRQRVHASMPNSAGPDGGKDSRDRLLGFCKRVRRKDAAQRLA